MNDFQTTRRRWFVGFVLILAIGCGGKSQPDTVRDGASDSPPTDSPPTDSPPSDPSSSDPSSSESIPSDVPADGRAAQIRRVSDLMAKQQADEAASVLRQMLVTNPADYEAIYFLAQVQATQGTYESAMETLRMIPANSSQVSTAAMGLAAQIALEAKDFAKAETQLRRLLDLQPSAQPARRELIRLLNLQGRRHEAVSLTRELCLSGDISEFELQTLILEADALYRTAEHRADASESIPVLIGEGGRARFMAANAYFHEAVAILEKRINAGEACQSDIALCGAAIAESQQSEKFQWWLSQTTEATKAFPEYWAAIGAHLLLQGEVEGAVRALGESILRDPTDVRSIRRMSKAFHALGQPETAERWLQRHLDLASTFQAMPFDAQGRQVSVEDLGRLTEALENLGRRLESIHWRAIAAIKNGSPASDLQALMDERTRIVQDQKSFPSRSDLLVGVRLNEFELPSGIITDSPNPIQPPSVQPDPPSVPVKFTNMADAIGIRHAYRVHSTDRRRAFAIHQTFGGGVAVLDFDCDGAPDLYLCQGAAAEPDFVADQSDSLYRNISGSDSNSQPVVIEVTQPASITELAYTLGVTAGDWNQDGFADLVISNLGPDYLLINQGDGTFRRRCLNPDDRLECLSTSVAMGDLDGDHLPDLFQLNYLEDSKMAIRPTTDKLGRADNTVAPHTFRHAMDRVWINDGHGQWMQSDVGDDPLHRSTALGLILGDLDPSSPGNEVFVANDEQADHLWKFDRSTNAWQESALTAGCAFGSLGFPVGSMGIAAADFDQSGTLDLHVTTFSQESSCHFLNASGFFQDTSVRHGVDRVSSMFMGFGCQAIDPGNRGAWDLLITNGHVEDLRHLGQSFSQPVQWLVNENGRFVEGEVEDPSGYWSSDHLGRALATVDFNGDGRTDFVTTDLIGDSAVLINDTESPYHWVRLHLVGSDSERDAVGAKVQVQSSGRVWTQWVTSGNGYLCKNESALHFGIGASQIIDRIEIDWPSGTHQSFAEIQVDRNLLIIETSADAWQR